MVVSRGSPLEAPVSPPQAVYTNVGCLSPVRSKATYSMTGTIGSLHPIAEPLMNQYQIIDGK